MMSTYPSIISEEEFIDAFGLSANDVAEKTGIPQDDLSKLITYIAGKMNISPAGVLNQARCLGMAESFLLNLSVKYNKGFTL